MALRSKETLEAFINKIIRNKKIMSLLKLPVILDTDSLDIIEKKRILIIDKCITTTIENPYEIAKDFKEIEINGIKYSEYGKTRMSVTLAQSIRMNNDIFANPQVDINIYYDNTNKGDIFKLLDLISDEFSGKDLKVKIEDKFEMIRSLKFELISSQVAMINNYERVGIRFSFYATILKN